MHPWMPFITEEIWHLIATRTEKDCIIIANWPTINKTDNKILAEFEVAKEIVATVRNVRAQKQLSPKEKLVVFENLMPIKVFLILQ
jgi:valyl-tRNA synthetase